MQIKTGFLIAVEGIDGSGKSTLITQLHNALQETRRPVVITREPGATQLGAQLRTLLQEKTIPVGDRAEFLLFAANRAQHFQEIIIPALRNGALIISDRMDASSLAYQGYGRGLDLATLRMINAWAMHHVTPDLTIYVRITPHLALERVRTRGATLTAFEKEREDFMHKVAAGYDELFANRTDVLILDGTQPTATLTADAMQAIQQLLNHRTV